MHTLRESTITTDELPGLVRATVADTAPLEKRTPGWAAVTEGIQGAEWHGPSGDSGNSFAQSNGTKGK